MASCSLDVVEWMCDHHLLFSRTDPPPLRDALGHLTLCSAAYTCARLTTIQISRAERDLINSTSLPVAITFLLCNTDETARENGLCYRRNEDEYQYYLLTMTHRSVTNGQEQPYYA